MHVAVEMDLSFSAVEYIVFDEADRCARFLAAVGARWRGLSRARARLLAACFARARLFEMGFELQMHEILHRLPESRQSVLFSATLPKALADFAKAGLHDPTLIRLDVDTKISTDLQVRPSLQGRMARRPARLTVPASVVFLFASALQLAFFAVPSESKIPFLLYLLRYVIPREQQTIVFVASKHHVEFLQQLLGLMNFAVTYVYGALDQSVSKMNVERFRAGRAKVRPRAQRA